VTNKRQDDPVEKVIEHLRDANQAFAEVLKGPIADPGPPGQLVARVGMFGFRQVEAIITLTEASEGYHLQVSQMVRSLLEAWSLAAWVVAPDDEEARLRRTIGVDRDGLSQYESKIAYNNKHFDSPDPAYLAILNERVAVTAAMEEDHGLESPPRVMDRMEALGRPDRYILYRWDSDAVHASTPGLGQLTDNSVEGVTILGVAGSTDVWLGRLAATWDVACDLYEVVTRQLGVTMEGWETQRAAAQADLESLGIDTAYV
jgi:hypothetical protein